MTCPQPNSHGHGAGVGSLGRHFSPSKEARDCSGTTFSESLKWWDYPVPTGNYEVSIKFNDEHIPESPYLVPVIAPSDDARRLTVLSLQVRRKEASISLATGWPVKPWTPEAASIPSVKGPSWFDRTCCQLIGEISHGRVSPRPHTEDRRQLGQVNTEPQSTNTSAFENKFVF